MYENLLPFVRRISLTLVNRDMVHGMLNTIAKGKASSKELDKVAASIADKFIKEIAKLLPGLFEAQVENFVASIMDSSGSDALAQLSKFAKAYPEKCPQSVALFEKLEKIVFEGVAEDAKHAMVILCKCQEDDRIQNIYNVKQVINFRLPSTIYRAMRPNWSVNYLFSNLYRCTRVSFSDKEIPKLSNSL